LDDPRRRLTESVSGYGIMTYSMRTSRRSENFLYWNQAVLESRT
jgi:hypothetical protein